MLTSYEVIEQGLSLVYCTYFSVCGLAVIRLQSCGHEDAVRDPLPKWIITLLRAIDCCFSSPCLSSPYPVVFLLSSSSLCHPFYCCFFFCFISTLGNAVYSRLIRLFLLCPSWERRAPLLFCFACLAGTITLEVAERYV